MIWDRPTSWWIFLLKRNQSFLVFGFFICGYFWREITDLLVLKITKYQTFFRERTWLKSFYNPSQLDIFLLTIFSLLVSCLRCRFLSQDYLFLLIFLCLLRRFVKYWIYILLIIVEIRVCLRLRISFPHLARIFQHEWFKIRELFESFEKIRIIPTGFLVDKTIFFCVSKNILWSITSGWHQQRGEKLLTGYSWIENVCRQRFFKILLQVLSYLTKDCKNDARHFET